MKIKFITYLVLPDLITFTVESKTVTNLRCSSIYYNLKDFGFATKLSGECDS